MIVSHKHKFIYFAVPRTATHSVREALMPHLGKDDWQQEGLNSKRRLPIPELAKAGHGHIGVRALKPHLSSEQWLGYYKFALVRHPYDRFLSVCAFLNRDNAEFSTDPLRWMLKAFEREQFRQRMLVRPQVEMLIDHDGRLALDFVGRFEHCGACLKNVAIRTGLETLQIPHRNASVRDELTLINDPTLLAVLNEFYRKDFELLGYSMTMN